LENIKIGIEKSQLDWINEQIKQGKIKSVNEAVREAINGLISKDKPLRNIPKEKLSEGVSLCKTNVLNYLKCAEALVNIGMSNYAIILFQFAKEEAGKLSLLIQKANELSSTISIPDDVFTNHMLKDKRAVEFLGNDPETWLIKGGFVKEGFEIINTFKGFESPIWTNHEIRLKCAFVDFDENNKEWKLGVEEHVPETLLFSIKKVKSLIYKVKF
jgi:hypothetical protein